MNRLRGPIGMVSAWLLVVAVGSAMVWTVISRAGDDLMSATHASLRASAPAAEKSGLTLAPPKVQETGKATLIKSKGPASANPETPDPGTPAPDERTPATEDIAPPNPPSDDPQPKDEDADPWHDGQWGGDGDKTPPDPKRASWQGTGGLVVAECVGWNISLIGAPANSGFHVDVAVWQRGLRVLFQSQDVGAQRTIVFGRCRDGAPIFFARTEGGSGDGGGNFGE